MGRPGIGRRGHHEHLQLPITVPWRTSGRDHHRGQDRMRFATFDVTTDSKADLIAMLMDWTHMADG